MPTLVLRAGLILMMPITHQLYSSPILGSTHSTNQILSDSLRNELLAERQRADAAQRNVADGARHRSLSNPARDNRSSEQNEDIAALQRKLALAFSEMEALRVHTKDLRGQIQSGCWSWLARDQNADKGGVMGSASDGEGRFSDVISSGAHAAAASVGSERGSGDQKASSQEVARLTSLLAERDVQVSVLTSTVEGLQALPSFEMSPKKSVGGGDAESNASPQLRGSCVAPSASGRNPSIFWAEVAPPNVDGGVSVLNHISAPGLARHCLALAVRLTSTTARQGAAERRADRLATEMERQERKARVATSLEADLVRRNRVLEKRTKKTAAALSVMRAESANRLRETGQEASKLR